MAYNDDMFEEGDIIEECPYEAVLAENQKIYRWASLLLALLLGYEIRTGMSALAWGMILLLIVIHGAERKIEKELSRGDCASD